MTALTTEKLSVEILTWRSFEKNTLRGFVTVRLPALHLVIHDLAVHERNGGRWVQLPAKPMLKDGVPVISRDTGKIEYARILSFDRKDVSDRFSTVVFEALDAYRAREGFA